MKLASLDFQRVWLAFVGATSDTKKSLATSKPVLFPGALHLLFLVLRRFLLGAAMAVTVGTFASADVTNTKVDVLLRNDSPGSPDATYNNKSVGAGFEVSNTSGAGDPTVDVNPVNNTIAVSSGGTAISYFD